MFSLLRQADVYAPTPLGRVDLLVAAGRVATIGRDLAAPRGVDCEVIDLAGARVIPGLIDAHVHVTGGGGEAGPHSRVPPLAAADLARAGVTTCVGLLGTDTTTRTMEDLVARTLGLRAEGLTAHCWTGGYEVPPRTLTGSVRRDITFVDPIIGAGETAISDHRSSQPTLDEILRLAADCHVAGLMTGKAGVLHLHVGDGPRGLDLVRHGLSVAEIPPRVFHPTHVNRNPRLFEEAMELAGLGVTVDVTAFPPADGDPAMDAPTAIGRWLDAGLPAAHLTVSSDGGGCLPTFDAAGRVARFDVGQPSALSDALAALLAAGRALEIVLPFFTANVADHLRLERKGHLRAGADADLCVLGPRGQVASVMAGGRWLLPPAG